MILRRILVVFFSLTRASTPLSELEGDVKQLSIRDGTFEKTAELYNPLPSLEDIISQGDALRAETLNDDIEAAVEKLNQQLSDLLNSGVAPLDVVPIINCFLFDAEELVLTAKKIQAYTLLKLLQIIYIWRDERQFHWFQALTYNSPWYDENMWNTHQMNWENNLWAICEWDNDALAMTMQRGISSQDELNNFNGKLLVLCTEYDAISVFDFTQMELFQPERHLGLMVTNCSIKLLRFYQSSKNIKHLDLDRFGLPKKLPASIDDFVYLMSQGYSYLPMDQLIERFCKKGRLDLLKYLFGLEPKLIPSSDDLNIAAEKGWLDILQWSHNLIRDRGISKDLAVKLAVNGHLEALDWLVNEYKIVFDDEIIKEVVDAEEPSILQWIHERQPFDCKQEWIDLAAENDDSITLKWFYEKSKLLPKVYFLRNATAKVLNWIKDTDSTLINGDLVEYGASNLELLQWIHKNAPISIFNGKKLILSLGIYDMDTMKWLYAELRICPANMKWAYKTGDLEAVQWALENCQILPTVENTVCAIDNGHVNVIRWLHENYPEHSKMTKAIKDFKHYGSRDVVDFIVSDFNPDLRITFNSLGGSTRWNTRLNYLKWIRERGHVFGESLLSQEIDKVASAGQLQPLLCFIEAFPEVRPSLSVWDSLAGHGHHKVYEWFMENHPNECGRERLSRDIQAAFNNGHLEMVKLILDKFPLFIVEISRLAVTRSNYHIKQWLLANFSPPRGLISK